MTTAAHPATEWVFALDEDIPIPYMQRTRDYYLALGYGNPYRWAHYTQVPFTPFSKPLADARVAFVTTAAPYQPGVGDQGPGAAYNAAGIGFVREDGTITAGNASGINDGACTMRIAVGQGIAMVIERV